MLTNSSRHSTKTLINQKQFFIRYTYVWSFYQFGSISMEVMILSIILQRELLQFLCFGRPQSICALVPRITFPFWLAYCGRISLLLPSRFIIMNSLQYWISIFHEICIRGRQNRSFLLLHLWLHSAFSLGLDK